MTQAYRIHLIAIALLLACVACTDMFMMIKHDCKAPPIEQNIIGTWRFGIREAVVEDTVSKNAPFTRNTFRAMGTITFTADGHVIDPDSLFSSYTPSRGHIIFTLYDLKGPSRQFGDPYKELGELFWFMMYNQNRIGQTQFSFGEFLKVIENDCNRIHLKNPSGGPELVLVR